ncbi:MAG: hypothetical protein O7D29_01710 [Gemmatimonadetes bacterium]|nr:hypothetical protein [Gemmatimonadota bacterium]
MQTPLQELRRIAESVGMLTGQTVQDVTIRSDCRQLRITLMDDAILLVSAHVDEAGKPRLDVDLVRVDVERDQRQLEVEFEKQG